jgi:hypothetical protein
MTMRWAINNAGLTRTSIESTRGVGVVQAVSQRTDAGHLCLMQVLHELLGSHCCRTTLCLPSATYVVGESYRQRDGAPACYHTDEKIFLVLIFLKNKK